MPESGTTTPPLVDAQSTSTGIAPRHAIRRIARVTLQLVSPIHVGSGESNGFTDALVVTDANGLPRLPGTSLAGALRAAVRCTAPDIVDDLFGWQNGNDGCGSRLSVSDGLLHDAGNEPVEGLVAWDRLTGAKADPIFAHALVTRRRDHVRLEHRGTTDPGGRGKFDEQYVAAGNRFTFELALVDRETGGTPHGSAWEALLETLFRPDLRLGGRTRRGYGSFQVLSSRHRSFDLRDPADFDAYANLPVRLRGATVEAAPGWLHGPAGLPNAAGAGTGRQAVGPRFLRLGLRLQPIGYWLFGGGTSAETPATDREAVSEDLVVWEPGPDGRLKGAIRAAQVLFPATGLKGALAHRVAFWFNALTRRFAGPADQSAGPLFDADSLAVRLLFGCVREEGTSERGRVMVDDVYLPEPPTRQWVNHVALDPFTGGARAQRLFCERPHWRGTVPPISIWIAEPSALPPGVLNAFRSALIDLCSGALSLGAAGGRGHGFFEGSFVSSDEGCFPSFPASS